jgi:ABC-type nitrate/sulfonate/bicarbonate transport system substrate-binding protein
MKIKEHVQYNRKDDKIEVARTFDNQPSLNRAEDLRKAKIGMTGDNKLVGSIPLNIMAQWCKDAGVKWDDIEARKEVVKKNILSGEFDKFRVWKGTF